MVEYFDAVIFDLDGVITRTARVHARAWKTLFDTYLKQRESRHGEAFVAFDMDTDYLQYVDGKPRYEGARSFLDSRGISLPWGTPTDAPDKETIHGLGEAKDRLFDQALHDQGVQSYGSSVELIHTLKAAGIKVAIVSSSKHCREVLAAAGLEQLFDAHMDGVLAEELALTGKPAPDIFLRSADMLGVRPERAVVVEDAVSGVEAGRDGHFGLVIGVDRCKQAEALLQHGADRVVNDLSEVDIARIDEWIADKFLPSALTTGEALMEKFRGRRVAVFLDYDGTLTPIVARPDLALLSDPMRETLQRLGRLCTTAVISGRALADVRQLVALDVLFYAGNHGLEIEGPENTQIRHDKGLAFVEAVDAAYRALQPCLQEIEGVLIEHKKFSLSVHYRLVDEQRVAEIERVVDTMLEQQPSLKKHHGKKVFEIRPRIDWNKGKALLWLLETLGLEDEAVLPVYIGDDVTDEDAFKVLQGRGLGILVTDGPCSTAASHGLKNTDEVKDFLDQLVQQLRGGAA